MSSVTIDCLDIARYFMVRADQGGFAASMSDLKLQQLLYYAQCLHLALYDEPFFLAEVQSLRSLPISLPADQDFLDRFSAEQKQLLEEVWAYFSEHSDRLNEAILKEPIAFEEMKKQGEMLLTEIETNHPAYTPVITKLLESAFSSDQPETLVGQGEVREWLESLLD
jgi:hypothetical protein